MPRKPCDHDNALLRFTNATEFLTAIRLNLFQVDQSGHATPKDLRATANEPPTNHQRTTNDAATDVTTDAATDVATDLAEARSELALGTSSKETIGKDTNV